MWALLALRECPRTFETHFSSVDQISEVGLANPLKLHHDKSSESGLHKKCTFFLSSSKRESGFLGQESRGEERGDRWTTKG